MAFKIFISYSQSDFFTRGKKIYNYLSQMFPEDDVFIDQIKPKAKQWRQENDKKLNESDLVVLVLTPGSIKSSEVQREVEIAKKLEKRILPCKMDALHMEWNDLPWNLSIDDGIAFELDEDLKTSLFATITEIKNEFPIEKTISSITDKVTVTVNTDKSSYADGEPIHIFGKTDQIISTFPMLIQILSPNGDLVAVAQVEVTQQGEYEISIQTGSVVWNLPGSYTVRALYAQMAIKAETQFLFSGSRTVNQIPSLSVAHVFGTDLDVNYMISGGKIINITKDSGVSSLLIEIEPSDNGELLIDIQRELLDAKMGDDDDSFFVLIDGSEIEFEEVSTSPLTRKLKIPFFSYTKTLEIVGTPSIQTPNSFTLHRNLNAKNSAKTHTVTIATSFDRTVYPLESTIYLQAILSDIVLDLPIVFEIYDSSGKLLLTKEIDPINYADLELKKSKIFQTSFRMEGADWKIGGHYTLRTTYGDAEALNTCTIRKRNPIIQIDKSVYMWNSDIILTVIDPDADKDSQQSEFIGDRPDAQVTIQSSQGKISNYRLRETGDSTGIFQGIIGLIGVHEDGTRQGYVLDDKIITKTQGTGIDDGFLEVKRIDQITFTYTNRSDIVRLSAQTSNFGATVELDQKRYSNTDKVYLTIVAPDYNIDSNVADEIGVNTGKITITTKNGKISGYRLIETDADTGIFAGMISLTPSSENLNCNATHHNAKGAGPTDGLIQALDDDYIEVSLNYFGITTVVGRALIKKL